VTTTTRTLVDIMPLYEFRCAECGGIFDRLMSVNDPAPVCASCGSERVNRLVSLIGGLVGSGSASGGSSRPTGGGCGCGGSCACGH